MLLAYNAASATIAANLGKWRPNAANPTGLYVPKLSDQFFRGWSGAAGREAGAWQGDAIRDISGTIGSITRFSSGAVDDGICKKHSGGTNFFVTPVSTGASLYDAGSTLAASSVVPTATENRPVNVALPVCIYLGLPA